MPNHVLKCPRDPSRGHFQRSALPLCFLDELPCRTQCVSPVIKYFQYTTSLILKVTLPGSATVFTGHRHISFPFCVNERRASQIQYQQTKRVTLGSTCFLPVAGPASVIDQSLEYRLADVL